MATMPQSTSTPSTPKAKAVWAMHLPPRSGAAFRPADGRTVDTRYTPWDAAGAAAGLIPGVYVVRSYTTKAGAESAHLTAAHPATDAALKFRQATRALAAAKATLDAAPELPKAKAPKGKGKGKGKGKA